MTGKDLLGLIEVHIGEYDSPDNYFLEEGEGPPPEWAAWPLVYLAYGADRDGCVNEQGPFGNLEELEQEIIRQAHAVFGPLRNAAVKEVGRTDTWEVQVWTEPSYEDTSQTLVIDDLHGIVLCHHVVKAWNFRWDTPAEMAEELELLYGQIVSNLRRAPAMGAATELLAACKLAIPELTAWSNSRQFRDVHNDPDEDYSKALRSILAAIEKAKGGVPSRT